MGAECTCSDYFYFEIPLPSFSNDSIYISFNDEIVKTTLTNIASFEDEIVFNIYPNPAQTFLSFNIPALNYRSFDYVILDIQGKVLQKGSLNNTFRIRLGYPDTGMFYIHIKNKNRNTEYISRFIKI